MLLELLSCGECLLADGDTINGSERDAMFAECERAGRLILSYSTDLTLLIDATEWLIKLYCEMGEIEKATILSEALPSVIGFNQEAALGRIFEHCKEYRKALDCYSSNVSQFQRQLIHSIVLCGNMHKLSGGKEKASEFYSLAVALSETFLEQNPVSRNESLQKSLVKTIERCKKTLEQIK